MHPPAIAASLGQIANSSSPLATDFADSLQNTSVTIGPITTTRRNYLAALVVNTTGHWLEVNSVNNVWTDVNTFADVAIAYRIDGGRVSELAPFTANGSATWLLFLPAGTHTVELWDSYQKSGSPVEGGFTYKIRSDGAFTYTSNPTATSRVVFYGDSITCGAYCTPEYSCFAALTKANFPGRVSCEAWGGRDLYDDMVSGSSGGFGNVTNLAARLVGLCFSATTKTIIDCMGYNDWSHGNLNAAGFGANVGTFYDAVHSADSTVQIISITPFITTAEATLNGQSQNIGAYRTAKAGAWTGRSWVHGYDGTTFATTAGIASGDAVGAHFNPVGNQAIYNGTGAAAGSNNLKAILGF